MVTETTHTIRLGDRVTVKGYDAQIGVVVNISHVFGGVSLEYQVRWDGDTESHAWWYEAHELERV